MLTQLTESQIEASDLADQRGETFSNVTPAQLFSPGAHSGPLMQTIFKVNPRRYRQLRDEYEMQIGATPRPLEYWHTLRGGK